MHANKLYKAILYTLILLLPTSCHWFSKKDGEIGKSLLMYMAVTSNLSGSISMNMEDVENSPFVPEYFEYPKESGDILLLLEHKEKSIPNWFGNLILLLHKELTWMILIQHQKTFNHSFKIKYLGHSS